jgi:RecB family exonuclease
VARGARVAEEALLAEVEHLAAEARADPALLARPVWIVVPSRSLRDHVAERVVARAGRSVAGVAVVPLHALAFEILRRASEGTPGGAGAFAVVVRKLARDEPELRGVLEGLRDGYGAVAAAVEDLLDAGFEPALAPALEECLEAAEQGVLTQRARAVVRVASATCRVLDGFGLEHRSNLVRRAEQALARDPGLLPARRVLIHGYADATGLQLELIATLVRAVEARVFLDLSSPSTAAFSDRLRERLEGLAPIEALPDPPPNAVPQLVRAPGAHAEVRAAAEAIQMLLSAGVTPERVGVVVRDLGAYASVLRTQFRRLGVPFSGARGRLSLLTPDGRRLRALVELVRARAEAPVDLWLEALSELAAEPASGTPGRSRLADLRIGLHVLGAGRLRDVAGLDPKGLLPPEDALPLPVRRGIETPDEEGHTEPGAGFAPRRRLRGELLREATARAESLVARFDSWARASDPASHVRHLRSVVCDDLGWDPRASSTVALLERLEALEAELPAALPLGPDDFALVLTRSLEDLGRAPLGGEGGGVRVLDAMEARALTFEHLFVLGLGRGVFPRRVREDPLLPDSVRRRLLEVLPDTPVKARGHDEERYLFAQLCSASPQVTLSWQAQTDDGKERNASPFVERLRAELPGEVRLAASLLADPERRTAHVARPALESALLTGIHRARSAFRAPFEIALDEGARACPDSPLHVPATALAQARCAVLDEVDPTLERSRNLGPFFGFVGPPDAQDPRSGALYVTTLESMARCPWRTFLEKVLRLEPVPDALEALPEVDPLLLGSTVHATLEAIVREATGDPPDASLRLEELVGRAPSDVPWPDPPRQRSLLMAAARSEALKAGIVLRGFAGLLAERAQPYLENIRRLEAPDGRLRGVLGAEVVGEARVGSAQARRALRFRVDRVDQGAAGLRLIDYKTGRLPGGVTQAAQWPRALEQALEGGLLLQAPAYARAEGADVAEGSYLFATPDVDPELARFGVEPGNGAVASRFEDSVDHLLRAWTAGAFGPRLENASGNEPRQCEWCAVSSACVRGDSSARRRLALWSQGTEEGDSPVTGAEAALSAVLRLHGGTR